MVNLARTIGISAALAAWAIGAQAQGVIFKQNEVTEDALINALSPRDGIGRTRSIMVRPSNGQSALGAPDLKASVMITFETNSATLTAEARSALDIMARALKSDRLADFRFAVEGHADPRGDDDYNMRLSQARAESVVAYLVQNHLLQRERLLPIGKGESELARPDLPAAPENRRVTLRTRVD